MLAAAVVRASAHVVGKYGFRRCATVVHKSPLSASKQNGTAEVNQQPHQRRRRKCKACACVCAREVEEKKGDKRRTGRREQKRPRGEPDEGKETT